MPNRNATNKKTFKKENKIMEEEYQDNTNMSAYDQGRVLKSVTKDYIESYAVQNKPLPSPHDISEELLQAIASEYSSVNCLKDGRNKWKSPTELPASCTAELLLETRLFARIVTDPNAEPSLYMYQKSGEHAGTYRFVDTKNSTFNQMVSEYNFKASERYRKEVLLYITNYAEMRSVTTNDKWVAVGNGAFNVATADFIPNTDPRYREKFVYLMKVHTDYNPLAVTNVYMTDPENGHTVDVDSFMESYFGTGSDMTELLWQLIYALVRYNRNYKVCHFFCNVDGANNSGSNGKSTLLDLFRSLLGEGTYCSPKIHELNERFALGRLSDTFAILVDEVAVDVPVEKIDVLKSLATRDSSLTSERKYADPRTFRWNGNMIFACNGWIKIMEKTGAAERRFYFWNFTKRFTGATDNPFIQETFVKDKKVHEYILYRVLHMGDIKKLIRPKEIDDNLAQYRIDNGNAVHEFLDTFALPDENGNIPLVWDMQPFKWLYALFQAWMQNEVQRRNTYSPKRFRLEVAAWAANHSDIWEVHTGDVHRKSGSMTQAEPLIAEYDVDGWYDPSYAKDGSLWYQRKRFTNNSCRPALKATYTGALIRKPYAAVPPVKN